MSSPSKRSRRQPKPKETQNQKVSDKKQGVQETECETIDKSDKKSGLQNGKFEAEKASEGLEAEVPSTPVSKQRDDASKKNKSPALPSTPPTAVRRSGRAPVPSSRYKDMEVTTPGVSRKRPIANSSEEACKGQELPKKRLKKQSKNLEAEVKSNELPADSIDSTEEDKSTETVAKKTSFACEEPLQDTKTPVTSTESLDGTVSSLKAKTILIEMCEDEVYSESTEEKKHPEENKTIKETFGMAEVEEERNEPISVEEMIEKSLQEGKIDKSDLETKLKADPTKGQESLVLDSKEPTLEINQPEPDDKTNEDMSVPEVEETEQAQPPSITIGGQNVTFEERNGETVAIVTIAPGLGESQEQVLSVVNAEAEGAASHPLTEMVSVLSNSHGGHTIVTDKAEDTALHQKLTIEARQFSTLLKPKPKASNPVSGHGRVIPRNEQQQMPAMIFKSGVGSPSLTPSTSLITVSAAHDGLHPKSGKKYSLLPPLPQKTTSLHGSITTRNSPRVIIVNQKGTDHVSTLKSPTETDLPDSESSSTLIHVKKPQGSSLSASDLECVLKALSSKNLSETGTDMPVSVEITEKTSSSTYAEHSENTESKEDDPPASTHVEEETVGDLGQGQEDQALEKTTEDIIGEDVKETEISTSETDDPSEKVEELAKADTSVDTATDEDVAPDSALKKALTEEVSGENLPVESALYRALQALEPANITSDQITSSEDPETAGATIELPDGKKVEGGDGKLSGSEKWAVKGDSIKVVDNGIEYDVRIVCQEDVTEEIVEHSTNQAKLAKLDDMTFKEEGLEATLEDESGMHTSGTQTLYNAENGSALQRMTTVVDKDGQKQQVYYVSVFPGKGLLNRVKSNQGARLTQASWVLSENGLYCCGKCNYKTDRKANFYKHRRLHIGNKPHICPICQYKAGTSSNLKRHMGIHKDIREHKCDICGLCFRQKIHLERHIKYKHEVKSVHCPLCDYVCANEQPDLKMHMKRKHSSGKSGEMLKCPECHVEVGSKKDLKQHMKFHKDGPELKLFCKECSFVTDCQSRLRRHAAIHSKHKPFQCGVCPYRAAQKEHVLRHLRTQHKIEVKRESKKTWKRQKQPEQEEIKTEKADFTSGDKIFACNHCTMRFAKLINLYKHLHTQHSDIMPAETSGNYYCVVCEFSTTTKKNLLVHMRRHNVTDQTPPTHVYSCVLCRYVNPKRRNLFQHMRKKHNIDISNQTEEEAETQVLEMGDVIRTVKDEVLTTQVIKKSIAGTHTGEALGTEDIHETTNSAELGNLASMIKIEDLTDSNSNPTAEGDDNMATLVIDTRAGESAPVQIVHAASASSLLQQQQHSVDALEGLQALAEQAGLVDNVIEEQVTSLDPNQHQQEAVILDQDGVNANTEVVEIVNGSEHLQDLQAVTLEAAGDVDLGAGAEFGGMELSEEQLSSLRHGDMVEMDGELYVVEMTSDPDQPNKQILSFVPVTATTVEEQG